MQGFNRSLTQVAAIVFLLASSAVIAQAPNLADRWSEFSQHHPLALSSSTNEFTSLRAEVVANRLQVSFARPEPEKASSMHLIVSADAPGHWPARDWRTIPMRATASGWQAPLPVEDLDVPIVYYVREGDNKASPLRIVYPRLSGLDEPTRIFWPFIDGFEDGMDGWRALDEEAVLKSSNAAHMGKSALTVSVAPGRGSSAVSTTRVRGWQVHGQRALGIRLWARKSQGEGRFRVSLLAHAFNAKQTIAAFPTEPKLGPQWQKIDFFFGSLPSFPLSELDLVTFEFIGAGEYLLDDVELLGPWPSETQ